MTLTEFLVPKWKFLFKVSIFISQIIVPYELVAQCSNTCGNNFLPNPGFETATANCNGTDNQLYVNQSPVANWFGTEAFNPNQMAGSTPDYFSPCGSTTNSANAGCMTGSGRVGFFTRSTFSLGREYIQAQLNAPLIAGKQYCFSMVVKSKVGAAGNILSSCDGVGAWFHNTGYIDIQSMNGGNQFLGPGSAVNASPQVENPAGNLIGASCVTVSGTFCATGGESYIVIGNFRDDANTQLTGSANYNYMYVDEVSLMEICNPDTVILSASPDSVSCGASSTLTAVASGFQGNISYSWPGQSFSGSGPFVVTPATTGVYTVIASGTGACGSLISDTASVTITVGPCGFSIQLQDTSICSGDCFNLISPIPAGGTAPYQYQWSNTVTTGPGPIPVCPVSDTIFVLTVTDSDGTTASDSLFVSISQVPVINVSNNITLCSGNTTTITASGADNYLWSTSDTSATITVNTPQSTSYTVTGYIGNCSTTDTVTINIAPLPVISLSKSDISCFGANDGMIQATVNSGTAPYQYLWIPTQSTSSIIDHLSAQNYHLNVIDANGCMDDDSITIFEPPALTLQISGQDTICSGSGTTLSVNSAGGTGSIQFSWNNGYTGSTQYIFPTDDTTVFVTATDQHNCMVSDSLNIIVTETPVAGFSFPQSGCAPYDADFINQSTGSNSYHWDFGDGTSSTLFQPQHLYSNDGCYNIQLIAINTYGCTDTVNSICGVQVFPIPVAGLQVISANVTESDPQVVFSNNSYGYDVCVFNPGEGNDFNFCSTEYTYTYSSTGNYTATLLVTNQYGCSDSVSLNIAVTPQPTLFVPNAFSPDGDGKNDYFQAKGYGISEFQLRIFDRWGEIIFTADDLNKSWDGTFRGIPSKEDVYIWQIYFKDKSGTIKNINGHVTLIR